jgi:hypothetical protein
MLLNLCTCTLCGEVWEDTNPQTGAALHLVEEKDRPRPLRWLQDPEEKDWFWGCPTCKTDAHLIDHVKTAHHELSGPAESPVREV